MGDGKREKDYDPTLLRAVGNILAGKGGILDMAASERDIYVHRAVKTVLAAKKELKRQMEE